MSNYKSEELNGVLKIRKSYEKLLEENVQLAKSLDYIIKEELMDIIKVLADRINIIQGNKEGDANYLDIKFTFEQMKQKL